MSTQGWGVDIRAKIVLQKRLGRDPTAKEFQDAIDSEDKFRATPEEIQRAFDEGHAVRCLFLVLSRCSPLRICSLYKHGV